MDPQPKDSLLRLTTSTRERLIDATERLYARDGMEATSLRSITAEAEANLAAIHYHFGSKKALTEEVFSRRLAPINRERLAMLDEIESEAGAGAASLESILEAFLGPALRRSVEPDYADFIRLMGRMYSEPSESLQKLIGRQFEEIIRRFSSALARTLTHIPASEVHWRFHFCVGSMVHTISDPARIQRVSGGLCDPSDVKGTTARLISFLAAGLNAPATSVDGEAS